MSEGGRGTLNNQAECMHTGGRPRIVRCVADANTELVNMFSSYYAPAIASIHAAACERPAPTAGRRRGGREGGMMLLRKGSSVQEEEEGTGED